MSPTANRARSARFSSLPRFHARFFLAASLVAGAACKKEKQGELPEPEPTAQSAAEPSVDPRLASPSGADAGAAADPHGGALAGGSPHGGMGSGNPPGLAAGGGGSTPEKTADGRVVLGPVTGSPPKEWRETPTSSRMRVAQWSIPGKTGEAELVVYYFGAGGAGGAQANLDRWINQFAQSDGSPSADKAKTSQKKVAGMAVTLVEVTGRYVAAVTPGAAEKNDKPDHMLLGAIVETSAGPYYFKAVGPETTLSSARKSFDGFIASLAPAK